MILIFFLQYFNYFGEVILSPLIYLFEMKYFSGEKNNQNQNPRLHYLIKLKYEKQKIPNSLRGSLSCLEFRGSQKEYAVQYDMHE